MERVDCEDKEQLQEPLDQISLSSADSASVDSDEEYKSTSL